ncbi:hypothetical protein EJ08DRAFT_338532 [Tothia fuscella]|uniref:Uncharacterized protein n=1 Tax=Tothia fuscella TaxID=1048955 RepID=A0A9P4NZN3_9PEZI|nr:hypothetical protein EJ08DRAFT_338532 [Tothia fuscella]
MARPKQNSKVPKQSKKGKEQQFLETENDYLEAADELESGAGKWRAGDAAKALRFYQKATATYEEGLKRYPRSFDLAYNKALILYQITQDSRLVSQIGPILDILQETLNAHRVALSIDQQNPDVLFNTAQVLTTFAEELMESDMDEKDTKPQATSFLQEAIELFAACLSRQEMDFTEAQALQNASADTQDGDDDAMTDEEAAEIPDKETPDEETPEQWATVLEPVTPSTLLDTSVAQLQCLATLARVVAPTQSSMLANISELAAPLTAQKIPYYISLLPTSVAEEEEKSAAFLSVSITAFSFHQGSPATSTNPRASAQLDADLAIAHFSANLADAEFGSQLLNAKDYYERVVDAYSPLQQSVRDDQSPSSHLRFLCEYADALTDFADSISESNNEREASAHRWTALSSAQTLLTKATDILKSSGASNNLSSPKKSQIYLQRGDIELQRWRLARLPSATASIASGAAVLLKNAGVYYRGAAGLAVQDGNEDIAGEAGVKAGVVKLVMDTSEGGVAFNPRNLFPNFEEDVVKGIMEDMIEEGLVDEDVMLLMKG